MKKNFILALLMTIFLGANAQYPSIDDSFFEKVAFVGAMRVNDWTEGWANWDPQTTDYTNKSTVVEVKDSISGSVNWTKDKSYLLKGFVYVVKGAVLTIEAGTVIKGEKSSMGTIIVERGGKLIANGTRNEPIVFTSDQPKGFRSWQDWGGIVLCGMASNNLPTKEAIIEGGPRSKYGAGTGTVNDADNSGSLKFIRIEFSGFPFETDKEINGLTCGSVGSGTTIENIMISYGGDDAFEFFGGTVNCKYLIAYKTQDDMFDCDFGYQGKVQYCIGISDPKKADKSGSNGFEVDNDASGSTNKPHTAPVFSNVTIIGPRNHDTTTTASYDANYKRIMHLRRNNRIRIYNSAFVGYPTGLMVDGTSTQTNAKNDSLVLKNCYITGMTKNFDVATGGLWTVNDSLSAWYLASSRANALGVSVMDHKLMDPFSKTKPDLRAMAVVDGPLWKKSNWATKTTVDTIAEPKYVSIGKVSQVGNVEVAIWPNPVVSDASIKVLINEETNLSVMVYDITGVLVTVLHNNKVSEGEYTMSFVPAKKGLYFVKVSTDNASETIKIIAQ